MEAIAIAATGILFVFGPYLGMVGAIALTAAFLVPFLRNNRPESA